MNPIRKMVDISLLVFGITASLCGLVSVFHGQPTGLIVFTVGLLFLAIREMQD